MKGRHRKIIRKLEVQAPELYRNKLKRREILHWITAVFR